METQLFTIHSRGRPGEVRVVGEAGFLGALPPIWAVWKGLWLVFALLTAVMVAAWFIQPLGLGIAYAALVALTFSEGSTLERTELRLRGWREVGVVEARSPEGAEELFFSGAAA